jgi:hypothetical protein
LSAREPGARARDLLVGARHLLDLLGNLRL